VLLSFPGGTPTYEMTRQICVGQGIPSGWAIQNIESVPGACGVIVPGWDNVNRIVFLIAGSSGQKAEICSTGPVPDNWVIMGYTSRTGRCGGTPYSIRQIQRM
jgi:hypothetical protein